MKRNTRHATSMLAVFLAIPAGAALAQAAYPTKPIRMLVGFAPGGGTDLTARVIARKLDDSFGQRVIVDNRPGASQIIASELTARASPDGYTMLMSAAGLTINPAFNSKLPFDTLRDFAAIALAARAPNVLVVAPGSSARTVKDVIALAKAKPGQLAYGSGGVSAPSHVSGALFAAMAGVQLTHVPYKGTGPAMVDLLSGQLPIAFPDMTAALTHIKSGRIPAIAVTTRDRSALLPDVPTVAESGLPGFECSSWFGLVGPAGMPKPIVAKLNETINRILKMQDVRDSLTNQGLAAVGGSAEEFAATISTELVKWKKLVDATGLKPQ